ncbi:MAG: hypothetical protein JRN68_08635 [Nitrososphaerota archaeon]|nr:hypothetical protein [Nitrososphaerota archaeon]
MSTYLSLSNALKHNLGFMLLDDPSQNLDFEHKKSLALILKGLNPSTQIVIGTHDSELGNLLTSELPRSGTFWYDLNWIPSEGTKVMRKDELNA